MPKKGRARGQAGEDRQIYKKEREGDKGPAALIVIDFMKLVIATLLLAALCCYGKEFQFAQGLQNAAETVNKGETFNILIASNPSTGFRWEVNPTLTKVTLEGQLTGEMVAPPAGLAGAPGQQKFRFIAKEVGTETIRFVYKRPWIDDADIKFDLAVTVAP